MLISLYFFVPVHPGTLRVTNSFLPFGMDRPCARRRLVCEYPAESRRGRRSPGSKTIIEVLTTLGGWHAPRVGVPVKCHSERPACMGIDSLACIPDGEWRKETFSRNLFVQTGSSFRSNGLLPPTVAVFTECTNSISIPMLTQTSSFRSCIRDFLSYSAPGISVVHIYLPSVTSIKCQYRGKGDVNDMGAFFIRTSLQDLIVAESSAQ